LLANEQAAEFIKQALKTRRLPRNQVAAISGLSNPYIKHLENGNIVNVERKKLIALAMALNLELHEIDQMLTLFDRSRLTENDIPLFIDPDRKLKITTAIMPLPVKFYFELVILNGERIPGRLIIVNDTPTGNVLPEGFRTLHGEKLATCHPVYIPLFEAIGRARKQNFIKQLKEFRVDHFICVQCLKDYIFRCPDEIYRSWRIKHLSCLIDTMETYEKFHVYLTNHCAKFNFTIKVTDAQLKEKDKLFFLGRSPHSQTVDENSHLTGFATENPAMVQNFMLDLKTNNENMITDLYSREKTIDYLRKLLEGN
jgi:transcriptional regulator with XRE-family HTH domain